MKSDNNVKVLILGATEMLGSTLLRFFHESKGFLVSGTGRSTNVIQTLPLKYRTLVRSGLDVDDFSCIESIFREINPDIVINCIGLLKQFATVNDPLISLPINSLLPHRLARLSDTYDARFIHVSTDCVFSGTTGMYVEDSLPDSVDLYGISKRLGEVDYPNAITLRTSMIGHELNSQHSLVDWFLSQSYKVKGFDKAIFSGLPTVEIARIIRDYVIPNPTMTGIYHISADPINKYDLLILVKKIYQKNINIIKNSDLVIDRSLDSMRFRNATGYSSVPWPEMIRTMYDFR